MRASTEIGSILVISQLPPPFHGSTMMTKILLEGLVARGISVSMLDKRFSRTVAEVGSPSPRKVLSAITLFGRLCATLITRRPNQAIFFCTNRPGSFLVDLVLSEILRASRIRIINYIHTQGYSDLANRNKCWAWLVRRQLSSAALTVCLSARLQDDITKWVPPASIALIPNTALNVPTQRTTSLGHDSLRVLFLSNLIPSKGPEVFVQLATDLLSAGHNATFDIVGATTSAEFTTNLKTTIEQSGYADKIELHGPADEKSKWDFLTGADLLVFPSEYEFEAFPLTIVEALSVGTPTVAYDRGGIGDLVQDSVTGYVVAGGDYSTLLARTSSTLHDPALRESLSKNALEDYSSRFSQAKFLDHWIDVLSNQPSRDSSS
jgi:glycosyltransferase involved in cell wall biosynthesis